jgi:hypothetical protein
MSESVFFESQNFFDIHVRSKKIRAKSKGMTCLGAMRTLSLPISPLLPAMPLVYQVSFLKNKKLMIRVVL